MPDRSPSTLALSGLLAGAGALHLAAPGSFDGMVPRLLPGSPRAWTYGSGVVELGLAAALLAPRTRGRAAYASAAFFVAVLPANLQMAYDWRRRPLPYRAAAIGRLPLQLPLVRWAWRVARSSPAGG